MLRKVIAKRMQNTHPGFQMRGHGVKRIETFSDAVFAFSITLLIVSLEVPKNFEELMLTIRGFFAFGISFLFLMFIWHEQNIFFRRYGMDDTITIVFNGALLFLVLFYVYPLKFLFTLLFSDEIYGDANSPLKMTQQQTPILMAIYGAGFIVIYSLFFFMYRHALMSKDLLELTPTEQFDTKTKMYSFSIFVSIGLFSILLAWLRPLEKSGLSGMFYISIGPALTILYTFRGKRRRLLNQPEPSSI